MQLGYKSNDIICYFLLKMIVKLCEYLGLTYTILQSFLNDCKRFQGFDPLEKGFKSPANQKSVLLREYKSPANWKTVSG